MLYLIPQEFYAFGKPVHVLCLQEVKEVKVQDFKSVTSQG